MWPRPVTVVEADPDGGRLAVRHNWSLRAGLGTLAASVGNAHHRVAEIRNVACGRNLSVVTAPVNPDDVIEAIGELSGTNWRLDEILGTDVLISVGIIRPGSPSETLMKNSDARMMVMRCTIDDVAAVLHRRQLLQGIGAWSILTAGGRLTTIQIARAVPWPVLADLLPSDRHNSAILRRRISEFAVALQPRLVTCDSSLVTNIGPDSR